MSSHFSMANILLVIAIPVITAYTLDFQHPAQSNSLYQNKMNFNLPSNRDFFRRRREAWDGGNSQCNIEGLTETELQTKMREATRNATLDEDCTDSVVMSYVGGKESGKILTISESYLTGEYNVWLSKGYGASFEDITSKFMPAEKNWLFLLQPVISVHAKNSDFVYVLGSDSYEQTLLFVSRDGAESFARMKLPFIIGVSAGLAGGIFWHPESPEKMLAIDDDDHLYVTGNLGGEWTSIQSNVAIAVWGEDDTHQNAIFFLEKNSPQESYSALHNLKKTTNNGESIEHIASRVNGFDVRGRVMYASIYDQELSSRSFHVSKDGGVTWNMGNLPEVTYLEFYSVLSIEDEMLTVHVNKNNQPDNRGTLYTSDADGIVFTESLRNHAYTAQGLFEPSRTDFFKVSSIRGTFISTVLDKDTDELRSVITFDRGGEWEDITVEGMCDGCKFLILNEVSGHFNLPTVNLPESQPRATGLVIANAVVYKSMDDLESTSADLYVSSDGGYTWRKSRTGMHMYEILDQGGVIIAIPTDAGEVYATTTDVFYSFDEGTCWHQFTFAQQQVIAVDIITEPGSLSFRATIWSKVHKPSEDYEWMTHTIDFYAVITGDCHDSDYTSWTAHELNDDNGCLLGIAEQFKRLKPDSFCRNTDSHLGGLAVAATPCKCTEDDYECEYGYYSKVGSTTCTPLVEGQVVDHICDKNGHLEMLQMKPYRKIPGDVCEGGVQHDEGRAVELDEYCKGTDAIDDRVVRVDKTAYNKKHSQPKQKGHTGFFLFFFLFAVVFTAAGFWVYSRKNKGRSTQMSYKNLDNPDDEGLISSEFDSPHNSSSPFGQPFSNGTNYSAPNQYSSYPVNKSTTSNIQSDYPTQTLVNINPDRPIIELDDEPLVA
jgi:sortilin